MSTFGADVDQVWPAVTGDSLPLTDFGRKLLKDCRQVKKPVAGDNDLKNMMAKSEEFPLEVCGTGSQSRWSLFQAFFPHPPVWCAKCPGEEAISSAAKGTMNIRLYRLLKQSVVHFVNDLHRTFCKKYPVFDTC